jgi:hypothetical protein
VLQQPVRAGGLALAYALATSALVLVTFLASNLVLSTIGGIGRVAAQTANQPTGQQTAEPEAAVLLSAEPRTRGERRCERRDRDARPQQRAAERCGEQRRNGDRLRP